MQFKPDRRNDPRKEMAPIPKVFDLNTDRYLGNLVNLSMGGAMLVSSANLSVGTVFQMRIDWPGALDKTESLVFGGEILWSEKSSEAGKQWLGIQIIDLSEKMAIRLQKWIHFDACGIKKIG